MNEKKIWIYSKISGVNQLLFETNFGIGALEEIFEADQYKKHKPFAYALVDGIEIKLFTDPLA